MTDNVQRTSIFSQTRGTPKNSVGWQACKTESNNNTAHAQKSNDVVKEDSFSSRTTNVSFNVPFDSTNIVTREHKPPVGSLASPFIASGRAKCTTQLPCACVRVRSTPRSANSTNYSILENKNKRKVSSYRASCGDSDRHVNVDHLRAVRKQTNVFTMVNHANTATFDFDFDLIMFFACAATCDSGR